LKYINSELKVKFDLDTTSKPKPVAGPDESVFPTEDDRHDVATIMLFQAYTGARPAEFVHASKGKASQDPLGEAEERESKWPHEKGEGDEDYGRASSPDDGPDPDYDDDSDDGNGPELDDDTLKCSDEEDEDDGNTAGDDDLSNKCADTNANPDSGYNSDGTDLSMKESGGEPAQQGCNTDEDGESTRACKALCYEDIIL
jgi:hypothetical protein